MPARSNSALVALLIALNASTVCAAAPAWPSAEAIEQAHAAHPFPEAERLMAVPIPRVPTITPHPQAIDIDGIARMHLKLKEGSIAERSAPATLRIFVTLAMPEPSLRLLIDQAERTEATLVLRGLEAGSMTQTLTAVQSLIGHRKVNWQIDPEAFNRYRVQYAPTFILTRSGSARPPLDDACGSACPREPAFFTVAGDVSLDHALEAIARRHPEARHPIAPLLQRLRGQP